MAVTEKDFTLSWGDITIGAPNTIAVTRPSSQYSFRFRCEFQGVTVNLTTPELMIVSQDDTRVVFQWTPDESLSLAIPDSVSGTGTLTMTVAYTSRFEQLSNPEFCVKTYDFTAYVPDSMRPSATLTVALYFYAKESSDTGVVFAIAAILMLLTMLINLIADLVGRYFRRKQQ